MRKARRLDLTPRARRDINRIIAWYRDMQGAASAAKVARTLKAGLKAATTIHPASATRHDLPTGFYRVVAKRHLIIFQIETDVSRVVRVLHGARDLAAALRETE